MSLSDIPKTVTKEYLDKNPNHIFVFGDNTIREGRGGAAILRDHPQSYGFITKKYPTYIPTAFYTPEQYTPIFNQEVDKLLKHIEQNKDKTYLISAIGAGLANKFNIFEKVINPSMKNLIKPSDRVIYLW
jgi:hypothetical protein